MPGISSKTVSSETAAFNYRHCFACWNQALLLNNPFKYKAETLSNICFIFYPKHIFWCIRHTITAVSFDFKPFFSLHPRIQLSPLTEWHCCVKVMLHLKQPCITVRNLIFHFSYQFWFESLSLLSVMPSDLETGIAWRQDYVIEGGYSYDFILIGGLLAVSKVSHILS